MLVKGLLDQINWGETIHPKLGIQSQWLESQIEWNPESDLITISLLPWVQCDQVPQAPCCCALIFTLWFSLGCFFLGIPEVSVLTDKPWGTWNVRAQGCSCFQGKECSTWKAGSEYNLIWWPLPNLCGQRVPWIHPQTFIINLFLSICRPYLCKRCHV